MRNWFAACIGFAMMFPVRLVEGANVRLPDVAAALLACGAVAALALRGPRVRSIHWSYFAIALLTFGWIGTDLTFRSYLPFNQSVSMILVRWLVALPSAYYAAVLAQDRAFRKWLVLGVVVGCLATNALTLSDLMTYRLTGQPQFLLQENSGLIKGDYRACGILDGANGAAIAGLFLVPFLIGAAEEFACYRLALAVSVPTICVVFYATQSRGPTLVSVGLLLLWGLMRRPKLLLQPVAVVILLGGLVAIADPVAHLPGSADDGLLGVITSRFGNDTAMQGDVSDRTDTTITSLQLAFDHPFGMGSTYEAPLEQATGFTATHNALTQLALMAGLPLSGLIIVMLAGGALRVFTARCRPQHWVGLYILLVSMFESAFYIPFFSFVVLWVIARTTLEAPGDAPSMMQSGLHTIDEGEGGPAPGRGLSVR
jgi:hypothetical protein